MLIISYLDKSKIAIFFIFIFNTCGTLLYDAPHTFQYILLIFLDSGMTLFVTDIIQHSVVSNIATYRNLFNYINASYIVLFFLKEKAMHILSFFFSIQNINSTHYETVQVNNYL